MGALRGALGSGARLLGDLDDAHYAWTQIEAAYASSPDYAERESRSGRLMAAEAPPAAPD